MHISAFLLKCFNTAMLSCTSPLSRLRKDVAENGTSIGPLLDSLKDVRSLQYEVDMLTNKVSRGTVQHPPQERGEGGDQMIWNIFATCRSWQ